MTSRRVISRTTTSSDLDSDYKWGFTIDIEEDFIPKGLNEDVVRLISAKKNEPDWMLEWRLKAFQFWSRQTYQEPRWAHIQHQPIDFQDIYYYAAPSSQKDRPKSLDEVYPEVLEAFSKLGIPLEELEKQRNANIPIGRVNEPEDIAEMAVFLAGPGSRNITGQAFNVDGGLVMH